MSGGVLLLIKLHFNLARPHNLLYDLELCLLEIRGHCFALFFYLLLSIFCCALLIYFCFCCLMNTLICSYNVRGLSACVRESE